jgi:hypothetical protein
MDGFSIWLGLLLLAWAVAAMVPIALILRRLGYSAWWVVIALISPLNVIGLWVLAFARWPRES